MQRIGGERSGDRGRRVFETCQRAGSDGGIWVGGEAAADAATTGSGSCSALEPLTRAIVVDVREQVNGELKGESEFPTPRGGRGARPRVRGVPPP